MKWQQAITKLVHDFRAKREGETSKERHQRTLEVARYMRQFDVEKVELKKSPLGGWMVTFEEDDPTETDHSEEHGLDDLGLPEEAMIREQRHSD